MSTGYRVYFNRVNEWPQVWSIDEGVGIDGKPVGEINVQGFSIVGRAYSYSDPNVGDRDTWSPRVWIFIPSANLDIVGGEAIITST